MQLGRRLPNSPRGPRLMNPSSSFELTVSETGLKSAFIEQKRRTYANSTLLPVVFEQGRDKGGQLLVTRSLSTGILKKVYIRTNVSNRSRDIGTFSPAASIALSHERSRDSST